MSQNLRFGTIALSSNLPTQARAFVTCIHKVFMQVNSVARTLKKLRTSKGYYWTKQWFSSIAFLFKTGTSLKGKNSLPLSFKSRSLWYGHHFTTLSDLPWMLLLLLSTCVTAYWELRQCRWRLRAYLRPSTLLDISLSFSRICDKYQHFVYSNRHFRWTLNMGSDVDEEPPESNIA